MVRQATGFVSGLEREIMETRSITLDQYFEAQDEFEKAFGTDATYLGKVEKNRELQIFYEGKSIINLSLEKLLQAWRNGLIF